MSDYVADETPLENESRWPSGPSLSWKASLWVDAFIVAFAYFAANTIHGLYYSAITQAMMTQARDGYESMAYMARLLGIIGIGTTLMQGVLTAGFFVWVRRHWREQRAIFVSMAGRISRREYWVYWFLPHLLLTLFIALVAVIVGFASGWENYRLAVITAMPSYVFMGLLLLWPTLTVHARRLHDLGRSAWWLLLLLVPIGNLIILIVVLCLRGKEGPNRFGPAGKAPPQG